MEEEEKLNNYNILFLRLLHLLTAEEYMSSEQTQFTIDGGIWSSA
jgi:hypothetical protein